MYYEFIGALNEVFPDVMVAGFPHLVGRNMILKQTFESGVTLIFFNSSPVMTPEGHPPQHLPLESRKSSPSYFILYLLTSKALAFSCPIFIFPVHSLSHCAFLNAGHKESTCRLSQSPEELVVHCTEESMMFTAISYSVNGETTHLGWQPLRIVATVSVLFSYC